MPAALFDGARTENARHQH